MKTYKSILLTSFLVIILAACGRNVDTDQPPPVIYGEDVCDRCNMIINEERFAAAYWTAEGEPRRFDDVGGMLAYLQENPEEEVASYWVHDVESGEWLNARDAYFVPHTAMKTPMGFGIGVYADRDQATALAEEHEAAEVITFDTLLAEVEAGELALDPRQHNHEDDEMEMDE